MLILVRPDGGRYAASRAGGVDHASRALAVCGVVALAIFVVPNWTDYRFYNWQMSVTRKPSYDLQSLMDRVTWFPILHDIFTRMWFTVAIGVVGAGCGAWRAGARVPPAERLLGLWIGLGALELLLHDVGNERRFVIFIPALVALTALVLGRRTRLLPVRARGDAPRDRRSSALPVVFYGLYMVAGALTGSSHLYERGPNVRLGAGRRGSCARRLVYLDLAATADGSARHASGVRRRRCSSRRSSPPANWRSSRSGRRDGPTRTTTPRSSSAPLLPPGTLVHGKLANGLALENRIRPVFVGRGFGNYEDRKQRDDVRYILTYVAPCLGYEGPVIQDVLDAYPNRTHHHDVRRRGDHHRPRSRRAHRQVRSGIGRATGRIRESCARLTSAPSRRTPTCGSGPSTTTRCSSTTAARR